MTRTQIPGASVAPTDAELQLDERNVAVLTSLVDGATSLSVADLAAGLVEHADVDAETKRVQVRLHHAVLPKLADAGLVDYDAVEHVVSSPSEEPALAAQG